MQVRIRGIPSNRRWVLEWGFDWRKLDRQPNPRLVIGDRYLLAVENEAIRHPVDDVRVLDARDDLEPAPTAPAGLDTGDAAKRAESITKTRLSRCAQVIATCFGASLSGSFL
jgi:hypothetical protein